MHRQAACYGAPGLGALLRRLVQVSRPRWTLLVYGLSPAGSLLAALLVMAGLGMSMPGPQDFARFSGLPELGLPAVIVLVFLVGGYGEELGWRGFALGRLQQRFGPVRGTLLLACVWAGWHLPAFGIIETYRQMTIPVILGGFLLGLACGSVVLARVAHRTRGSILAVALWHGSYNLTSATSAGRGFISAFTTACVMVWAFVLLTREWRRPPEASLLLVDLQAPRL